jgi:hypothetical protein
MLSKVSLFAFIGYNNNNNNNNKSVALVHEWTIPTEWLPLVGEVSATAVISVF